MDSKPLHTLLSVGSFSLNELIKAQALMKNADYAMSGAASVYQSICGFVLIVAANKIVKRFQSDSSLF